MMETNGSLHLIENKSLRERVLEMLREAIINGEMKPGQALIEMELAAQLGVSRAPIREAIQTLSSEGLVESASYRGTIVRKLTRKDIEELYSLRSVLEEFAVRQIIAQANPESVERLRAVFDAMLAEAQAGNLRGVNSLDRDFHDALIELSGHDMLLSTWRVVSMRVRQVMALRNRRNSDITQIAYNHLPIIEAIAARDSQRAVEVIHKHVATTGDLIAENWEEES